MNEGCMKATRGCKWAKARDRNILVRYVVVAAAVGKIQRRNNGDDGGTLRSTLVLQQLMCCGDGVHFDHGESQKFVSRQFTGSGATNPQQLTEGQQKGLIYAA
eukprot:scaffold163741_cov66-Cyclotella_meneghiniana.AAC.3